jgi:5-methylcytosine-specific restriction endonuclease McrBC regulatory subunit McrC
MHFGKFAAFACDFNEFDRDTAENHLLLAGVMKARRATTNAMVRRRAADLERRLADVAPTLPSRRSLLATTIVYGRRNSHYRTAHTWCRSLLRVGRVDDDARPGSTDTPAFMINMNPLFEKFVGWLIECVYDDTGVNLQAQKRNLSLITVNGQQTRAIAPDFVVSQSGRSIALDAKYKQYDEWEISPADVYQLLLYAQCYTGFTAVPTSYLIHPTSKRQTSPTVVELTVPADDGPRKVRIDAVGIPLAQIVGGLRTGDHEPLRSTVDQMRSTLPGVPALP